MDDNTRKTLDLAEKTMFEGDEKEARRLYSRVMVEDPDFTAAWIAHTFLVLISGEQVEAETWISRALSLFPNAPAFHAFRSVAQMRAKENADALARSEKLAAENSNNPIILLCRALILAKAGRRADQPFKQGILLLEAGDWRTPLMAGMLFENERLFAKAIECYEAALRMRDDFGYGWFRIAQSRAATGKRGEARKALLHAEFLATGNEKLRLRINKAMDSRQFAGFLKRFFSLR